MATDSVIVVSFQILPRKYFSAGTTAASGTFDSYNIVIVIKMIIL